MRKTGSAIHQCEALLRGTTIRCSANGRPSIQPNGTTRHLCTSHRRQDPKGIRFWESPLHTETKPVATNLTNFEVKFSTPKDVVNTTTEVLATSPGGEHYRKQKIQPILYIEANGIPFHEANVIKYVTRWRDKNGLEDLKKARFYIDRLIELEEAK